MEKAALVTGGSRGIGQAIVRALAGAGFHVTFTYRRSRDAADALVAEGYVLLSPQRARKNRELSAAQAPLQCNS